LQTGQHSIQQYLIKRSQLGDRNAQSEIFKLYAGAMYNVCRRMMGDDEDAQDMLQDSFIDAFTKLKNLKKLETFPAWLKRIVVNNCINELNKKKRITNELEESLSMSEEMSISNESDMDYEVRKILNAIDHISEGCRVVLNLYLFEGYDHKEIGQILSITESASKAQYSKAKARIRKILTEETI
jgi:RNA polymerase sigma-70 factor (ECF subfamily)